MSLATYQGVCSECGKPAIVANDPAGFGVPFCEPCYYETF